MTSVYSLNSHAEVPRPFLLRPGNEARYRKNFMHIYSTSYGLGGANFSHLHLPESLADERSSFAIGLIELAVG